MPAVRLPACAEVAVSEARTDDGEDVRVAEVLELELRLLDPTVRADRAELERLLHPDFHEFGASGRMWGRDALVEALISEPGTGAVIEDAQAPLARDDAVLITYRAVSVGGSSWRSSLWIRDEMGWRVLFHQGTPADPGNQG